MAAASAQRPQSNGKAESLSLLNLQFVYSCVLHGPLNGQRELLEGTEENQGDLNIIRAGFVGWSFWLYSILWTEMVGEEELGAGILTVLQDCEIPIPHSHKEPGLHLASLHHDWLHIPLQ